MGEQTQAIILYRRRFGGSLNRLFLFAFWLGLLGILLLWLLFLWASLLRLLGSAAAAAAAALSLLLSSCLFRSLFLLKGTTFCLCEFWLWLDTRRRSSILLFLLGRGLGRRRGRGCFSAGGSCRLGGVVGHDKSDLSLGNGCRDGSRFSAKSLVSSILQAHSSSVEVTRRAGPDAD